MYVRKPAPTDAFMRLTAAHSPGRGCVAPVVEECWLRGMEEVIQGERKRSVEVGARSTMIDDSWLSVRSVRSYLTKTRWAFPDCLAQRGGRKPGSGGRGSSLLPPRSRCWITQQGERATSREGSCREPVTAQVPDLVWVQPGIARTSRRASFAAQSASKCFVRTRWTSGYGDYERKCTPAALKPDASRPFELPMPCAE